MIHLRHLLLCLLPLAALAAPVSAQTWVNQNWTSPQQETASSITAKLNGQSGLVAVGQSGLVAPVEAAAPVADFAPVVEFAETYAAVEERSPFATTTTRDIWRDGEGYSDRVRLRTRGELRRADGSPVPLTPLDAAAYSAEGYDLTYTRGWNVARGYTENGLEVTLTPHAGIGVGDRGGTAEAGATLRIGSAAERLLPEGSAAFGERARWYIYAAGSGTAVGYNFARNRDGDYRSSGYSRDNGAFLGDASLGVAIRKGDVQGSFGLVYREVRAEGLTAHGVDTDVSEGLVAFQLSIKPEW